MEIAAVLTAVLTVINIGLAFYNIHKEWRARRTPKPHPLEVSVRELVRSVDTMGERTDAAIRAAFRAREDGAS